VNPSGIQPPKGFGGWPPAGQGFNSPDTVPAWLTPGEAVLNPQAAQMAGRGNIDNLNRLGQGTVGYAGGIGYVDPQSVDPAQQNVQLTAPSISPALLGDLKTKAAQAGISPTAFNGLLQAVMKGLNKPGQQAPPPSANYAAAGSPAPVYGASGYPSAIPAQGYKWGDANVEPSPIPGASQGDKFYGGAQFNPNRWGDVDQAYQDVYNPRELNQLQSMTDSLQMLGYLPPSNTPGFAQGPTAIQSTFDPQGYPYAVPVTGETYLLTGHGTPMKKPS
jgi:hypothetical protein